MPHSRVLEKDKTGTRQLQWDRKKPAEVFEVRDFFINTVSNKWISEKSLFKSS